MMHYAASWYARIPRWPVFPVEPGGKRPLVKHGLHEATTDEATIALWWRRWPDAGIGVRTGHAGCGAVVLDVDVGKGGEQSLAALGELPRGPEALTGGGGAHLFFSYFPIGNRAGFRPGLDLRGDGGYVVVAPSLHASGRRYEWQPNAWPHRVALPEAPPWLVSMLIDRSTPEPARFPLHVAEGSPVDRARRYLAKRDPAIEGCGGDAHTFRTAAIVARGFGLSTEETLEAMAEWNSRCSPPWSSRALLRKINNAITYGTEPVGARLQRTA